MFIFIIPKYTEGVADPGPHLFILNDISSIRCGGAVNAVESYARNCVKILDNDTLSELDRLVHEL
ncbi:MAG: hypothetical protein LPD71_00365 [Shewanella sp.]|nr:hypothetical protein [Shewanella sp.]MCF1431924.1 hypothetical protein [Shewanella sp.]MCF1437253.1 hypothetical protein [Shewanella sp.]